MGVFQSTRHLLPGTMTSNPSVPSTYNLVSSHLQMAATSNHCRSASHTRKDRNNLGKKQGRRNNQDSDSISPRSLVPFLARLRSATIQLCPLPSAIGGMPHSQTIMTPPPSPTQTRCYPSIITITISPPAHRHLIRFDTIPSRPRMPLVDFPSRHTNGRTDSHIRSPERPGQTGATIHDDGTIQL